MQFINSRQIIRTATSVAIAGLVGLSGALHAQTASADDMGNFIAERGIIAKIGEQVSLASRAVSNTASDLVVNAMGFLGVPYKRGGNSAETGFDCSGFVKAMYEQTVGQVLPRRAVEQAAATQTIDKTELQPGDLVFFNTLRSAFSHVGIYVGDNKFIHSPRSGSVVRVEDMRISYWSSRFDGARRVQPPAGALPTLQNTIQNTTQSTTQKMQAGKATP